VIYVRNTYQELYPTRLNIAATLAGQLPPDLTRPFRYADLGCGFGLTATVVAATYPHAEVWGFDFNPAHIDAARRLADAAGLTNLRFEEASFGDLSARPADALPMFDYIVSHGVISWIAPEIRADLFRVIGQRLTPGGLAYVSYNTTTGSAQMQPIQRLMRMLMDASPDNSLEAMKGAIEYLGLIKGAGAQYFAHNPLAAKRVEDLGKNNTHYLVHEFGNAHWQPLMFADVAAAMADSKCTYVGSSHTPQSIDGVTVPPDMLPLFSETTDPILKETLRDIACGNGFRRDVFRRGIGPVLPVEANQRLDAMGFCWVSGPPADQIKLNTPLGEVIGLPEIYQPLTQALYERKIMTIAELRQLPALSKRPIGDILQPVLLLLGSNLLTPVLPEAIRGAGLASATRLTAALAEADAMGATNHRIACSALGADLTLDAVDILVLREKLAGRSLDLPDLADRVLSTLTLTGRTLQRDGQPVTDLNVARGILTDNIAQCLAERLPFYARLGALPA